MQNTLIHYLVVPLVLCICTITSAQNNFVRRIDIGAETVGQAIAQTADGNFFIAGHYYTTTTVSLQNPHPFLLKTDPQGNVLWEKTLDFILGSQAISLVATPNNTVVLSMNVSSTGNYGRLITKFDQSGAVVWASRLDNITFNDVSMTGCFDGGVALVGDIGGTAVVRFDSNGKLEWANGIRDRSVLYGMHPTGIVQCTDSSFVIGGNDINYSSYELAKFSPNGNIVWQRRDSSPLIMNLFAMTRTKDNGVACAGAALVRRDPAGDSYVCKYNKDGGLVWDEAIDLFEDGAGRTICETSNGDLITCGSIVSQRGASIDSLSVIHLDKDGTIKASTIMSIPGNINFGLSSTATTGGGYAITGVVPRTSVPRQIQSVLFISSDAHDGMCHFSDRLYTTHPVSKGEDSVFYPYAPKAFADSINIDQLLYSTDYHGLDLCTFSSVDALSDRNTGLTLTPNPSSRGRVILTVAELEAGSYSIMVRGILGQIAAEIPMNIARGKQELSIDVSMLATGTYFIELKKEANGEVISRSTFVKQ